MGWLSKAWKGVKGAVKGVAKGIKKVAKGVITSIPGGQKLWKEGGRLGTKVMAGFGKLAGKLGPIGMMALSFVLAPIVGPALGALWSGFGAGAAGMAASGNLLVSTLGNVGSGVFAAGNFAAGTIGALGNAVSQGASNLASGNFSAAASSFGNNMMSALSGEAGMASVNAAAATAAQSAGTLLADPSQVMGATPGGSFEAIDMGLDPTAITGGPLSPVTGMPLDPSLTTNVGNVGSNLGNGLSNTGPQFSNLNTPLATVEQQASQALYGMDSIPSTLSDQDAFMKYGKEGVNAIKNPTYNSGKPNISKAISNARTAKSFLGGGAGTGEPVRTRRVATPDAPSNINTGALNQRRGVGGSGYSLLNPIAGLQEGVMNSTRLLGLSV